jgi:YcaO-like protein with predicted kinase domain
MDRWKMRIDVTPIRKMSLSSGKLWQGTRRAVDPAVTISRVRAIAKDIGISRVAWVTGLDFIGLPVTMVVRPQARTLSVSQGKGVTQDLAMASGLMESFECYCAERVSGPVEWLEWGEASRDPHCIAPEIMRMAKPAAREEMPWSEAFDMHTGEAQLLPSELVFADFTYPPPKGHGYFRATTNGLASGNTRAEAELHALCEVIERDCVALWMTARAYGRATPSIDTESLRGPATLHLLEMIEATELDFEIWDITSDTGVPCFLCVIDDQNMGLHYSIGKIVGSGCHPSTDIAMSRAITEAAQSRLTIIAGSRDDIEMSVYRAMAVNNLLKSLFSTRGQASQVAFEDRSILGMSVERDLQNVLARLAVAGVGHILCAPLPSPVPELSVVRVLAPGLEGGYDKHWYRPGARAQAVKAQCA